MRNPLTATSTGVRLLLLPLLPAPVLAPLAHRGWLPPHAAGFRAHLLAPAAPGSNRTRSVSVPPAVPSVARASPATILLVPATVPLTTAPAPMTVLLSSPPPASPRPQPCVAVPPSAHAMRPAVAA